MPLAVILIVPMCMLSALVGISLSGGDNNVFGAVFVERSLDRAPHVTLGGSVDRRHQQTSLSGDERSLDESYSLGFDAG